MPTATVSVVDPADTDSMSALNAPNLANVKVPGQAAPDLRRGMAFPHSGWNLDGSELPGHYRVSREIHSRTSKRIAHPPPNRETVCQMDTQEVSGRFQASQTDSHSDEIPRPQAIRGRRDTGMTTEEMS